MKVSALSSAFLGALLPALERARHFALAGKMYRVNVKDADALGQVCLVEKMSLVLFVFFWVDRDHPRSTCNRISLTGRTADQDPVFCTIQAFRNTSVDLVGWETLIVAKLRIPRFRVSSGAFFWIGLIE